MKDIFVSYSKKDADRVRILVEALERQGWTIWWDRTIPPGKTWAQVIEDAITGCRCTLVVWSENSTQSDWVHKEARKGEQRRNLIPVAIDNVPPPFEFEHLQAASLVGWDGVSPHDQWDHLVEQITAVVEASGATDEVRERVQAERERSRSSLWVKRIAASVIAGVAFLALGAALFVRSTSVDIELQELKLDGLSFDISAPDGSAGSVLVSDEIQAHDVLASGLRQVRVPRSADSPAQAFGDDTRILLRTRSGVGTIGLTSLELPVGARVSLRENAPDYLMRIGGNTRPVAVAVTDSVLTAIGDLRATLDYGVGGRIELLPDSQNFQLEFEPAEKSITLIENLAISNLELHRFDQDVEISKTRITATSTIYGGTLSADWESRELDPKEELHFDAFDGRILNLRLDGDTIVLTAHGAVSGMQVGFGDAAENRMPALFTSLSRPAKIATAALAILFLAGVLFINVRLWRRTL